MIKFFDNLRIRTEVIVNAVLASLLLRLPPRWLKKKVLAPCDRTFLNKPVSVHFLLQLSDLTTDLEKFIPWRYKCYEQAVTARLILNRRKQPNELFLGVINKDEGKGFHAWVTCQGLVLTGYGNIEDYHIINCYK